MADIKRVLHIATDTGSGWLVLDSLHAGQSGSITDHADPTGIIVFEHRGDQAVIWYSHAGISKEHGRHRTVKSLKRSLITRIDPGGLFEMGYTQKGGKGAKLRFALRTHPVRELDPNKVRGLR